MAQHVCDRTDFKLCTRSVKYTDIWGSLCKVRQLRRWQLLIDFQQLICDEAQTRPKKAPKRQYKVIKIISVGVSLFEATKLMVKRSHNSFERVIDNNL